MNDNHKVIIIGCHAFGFAFGFAFHLRNDLKIKTLLATKDVVDYAGKGTKLMVKKRMDGTATRIQVKAITYLLQTF